MEKLTDLWQAYCRLCSWRSPYLPLEEVKASAETHLQTLHYEPKTHAIEFINAQDEDVPF